MISNVGLTLHGCTPLCIVSLLAVAGAKQGVSNAEARSFLFALMWHLAPSLLTKQLSPWQVFVVMFLEGMEENHVVSTWVCTLQCYFSILFQMTFRWDCKLEGETTADRCDL